MLFRTIRTFVAAVVAVLVGGSSAWASGVVSVGFEPSYPPFMYVEYAKGPVLGLYPEIVGAVFARAGIPVAKFVASWPEIIDGVDRGKNGIAGIYKNAQRLEKYDFSAPIFEEDLALYTRVGKPVEFKELDDLRGMTIGVVRGWSYGDDFDRAKVSGKIKVEEALSDRMNVKRLSIGRLDVIVGSPLFVDREIERLGLQGQISREPVLFARNPSHLAFTKSAGKKRILDMFDQALAQMKADGSYDAIIKKALPE